LVLAFKVREILEEIKFKMIGTKLEIEIDLRKIGLQ